jgi:glucose dehydrogenase
MRPLHRFLRASFFVVLSGAALVAQQPPPAQVSPQEILDGLPADGSKWLTFGGNYFNHRHSPLTQINAQNVNKLAPQWTFQTDTLGRFETTPLFRDNVLYVPARRTSRGRSTRAPASRSGATSASCRRPG